MDSFEKDELVALKMASPSLDFKTFNVKQELINNRKSEVFGVIIRKYFPNSKRFPWIMLVECRLEDGSIATYASYEVRCLAIKVEDF